MFSLSPKGGYKGVDSFAFPMSPFRTLRRGVKGAPKKNGLGEKVFLEQVKTSDGFWRALGGLSQTSGIEVDELQHFAEEVCKCCWTEAGHAMLKEDPVRSALAEVDRLRQKVNQCNLAAMKQMAAAKANAHAEGDLGEDTIAFFEPLQYVDESTKDLVLTIVNEKVRLLDIGRAPPSLVAALARNASAQAQPTETVDAAELKELRAELEVTRMELRRTRGRLEDAETEATEWRRKFTAAEERGKTLQQDLDTTKGLLDVAEARAAQVESALEEVKAREASLRKAYEDLQQRCAQQEDKIECQQAEIERLLADNACQAVEIDRQRDQLDRLGAELVQERQANTQLRADVASLECQLAHEREVNAELRAEVLRLQEFVRRAEQLEQELNALQDRFDTLATEASAMREELARRNNTRTQGTQTSLTGAKLEEQANENKSLKLMIQELQEKLKELMEKCRRKGIGKEVAQLAEELGLQEVLKENTVFQRLFDDALHRIQRLEKLREKVRKEQSRAWPDGVKHSPRTAAVLQGSAVGAVSPEVPVRQAMEENPLRAVRRMVQTNELLVPPPRSMVHSDYGEMKTSTSLPTLPAVHPHNCTVLNMELPGRSRNSKLRHP
jgi:chromosome segregation ATPase